MQGKHKFQKIGVVYAIVCTAFGFLPQIALADDQVDKPYDWVIQVETRRLERQFDYKNSKLNPVEKLEVLWYPTKDETKKTKYEYMYYHDGKPYGMEKLRKFDIDEGDGVAIEIKHKENNATDAEKRDAANAVFRLALDSYLHKNPVVAVKVPMDSFNTVSNRLMELGFHDSKDDGDELETDSKFTASMTLGLYSVPEGKQITLVR
ncbi:MAG TPA: hypothetical protein EYN91_02605 [Candidatus Melainabacteria bacterium]|nr:hypothetical protein [Candidatus Melainabacteria bacterium]HIN67150.1 hypothetical protein [Candidatus Obscuribacterales bacterium]